MSDIAKDANGQQLSNDELAQANGGTFLGLGNVTSIHPAGTYIPHFPVEPHYDGASMDAYIAS
jgi:hypothetical protein